jgi:hypothetical protein
MKHRIVSLLLRKSLISTAISLSALWAVPAWAQLERMTPDEQGNYYPDPTQEVPLSGTELLEAFSGKTHRGTYNFQRAEIDTFAFTETTHADGRTEHWHGDKLDTGTWRVKANVICFDYENWDGGTHQACFNIFKRGNCYYHYGLRLGLGQGAFTARSVHAGETPECEPPMS